MGLLRYFRLFDSLPSDSRIMMKLVPANSWTFDREMQSSILYELRRLNANYYNSHKDKAKQAIKVGEQDRPDYVNEAIEEYRESQKLISKQLCENGATVDFWKSRNPDVEFTQ